ncbi:hypothetical protein BWQ96_04958 [Gracilariopsis chorda]|uniref:Uncharacterized protein n=1 Tax=Gracilariopsis chorda TaxID=448386 RepID=A0A2V3IT32_9FLOR|nr:hypothetical protein BWQ96_04958 [Gracilariopsis chorda]|eukprot:PXF45259.1 hypothetical protein BWQ96_04958 [Gracilariopsis chorda]
MDPPNQNEEQSGQLHIEFDLVHFPQSLERAERMLRENRRVIDGNEFVPVAHLQRVNDALFDLISHAETLHTSSKDVYAKLQEAEAKVKSEGTQQELEEASKRVKTLQKKVNIQKSKIKRLKRRIGYLEVPVETTDKLWFPLTRSDTDTWPDTGAWSSVSTPSSPRSEHASTWEADNSECTPWVMSAPTNPEKDEPWLSPDETWVVNDPPDTWDFERPTEQCYTLQTGIEVAGTTGKYDSAFVGYVEKYRECVIRRPAFAQMVDEHPVVPCKFQLYTPFKPDETCDGTEITYFGFHYPDGTTLPYVPVQNVTLLYHDGIGTDGSLEREQSPWSVCEGHSAIEIEMSEKVLYQIERNSVELFRESILSGVDENSEEYYRLRKEGWTRVQGPEVEYTRNGKAHLVVALNRQCYVRRTVDGCNHTLGLLQSIMKEKRSDLEADATFFVRAVKQRETNGVAIINLKLNSVFVDGHEFTL